MTEPGDRAAADGDTTRRRPLPGPPKRRPRPGPGPADEPTAVPVSVPVVLTKADPTPAADAAPGDVRVVAPAGARWWRRPYSHRVSLAIRTVVVVGVAVLVAALLRIYVVEPFYIPSQSMEPTLVGCPGCTDDHILVDKLSYRFESVHAGDIVVFHKPPKADLPDDVLIKRVIAVAGQKLQLRDGNVYVNGLELDESYVNKACGKHPTQPLDGTSSWIIPKGDVFVMGDNRCQSEDSRAFGPITTSSIIGKAVFIVWPLSRFGSIH